MAEPAAAAADAVFQLAAAGDGRLAILRADLVPQVPPGVTGHGFYPHLGLAVTFSASYAGLAADRSLVDCYLYALHNPRAPMR
jgi:hypothetical protein